MSTTTDDDFNMCCNLFRESQNTDWVVVEAGLNVFQGKAAVSNGGEQKRESLFDTRPSGGLLAEFFGELVRGAFHTESIDSLQTLPESLLIFSVRKTFRVRELVGREEQRVD